MIIPEGLTVNIGRREYKEGDSLPNNAPEAVKKQVNEHITKHGKKPEELKNSVSSPAAGNIPAKTEKAE